MCCTHRHWLRVYLLKECEILDNCSSRKRKNQGELQRLKHSAIGPLIFKIRTLLEQELEQDNGLIAEFTDKVMSLEQDVLSKNECIEVLNKHVDNLRSKNGDYARELSRLSSTINELVDSNDENIGNMIELEQDVAEKKDAIDDMADELQEK